MWKYCDKISQLGFFILYIIFLSFISFSSIHSFLFFFFFFYFFFSSTCPLSSVLSLPPSFIFFFSSRTFQTSGKRERERRKDKAGGDQGHRKDRVGAALPRPPLVVLPTTRLGQIGFLVLSFFFFSFFFSYLLVLWCENTKKQRRENLREKKEI